MASPAPGWLASRSRSRDVALRSADRVFIERRRGRAGCPARCDTSTGGGGAHPAGRRAAETYSRNRGDRGSDSGTARRFPIAASRTWRPSLAPVFGLGGRLARGLARRLGLGWLGAWWQPSLRRRLGLGFRGRSSPSPRPWASGLAFAGGLAAALGLDGRSLAFGMTRPVTVDQREPHLVKSHVKRPDFRDRKLLFRAHPTGGFNRSGRHVEVQRHLQLAEHAPFGQAPPAGAPIRRFRPRRCLRACGFFRCCTAARSGKISSPPPSRTGSARGPG